MISFLKKLIKIGQISNLESILDVTEKEYLILFSEIKDHGWNGFNSKKNFESYEKKVLKVIKYQNKNNIDDELLLLTLANYFYIKALTDITLGENFDEIAIQFQICISSYYKSVEYLKNPSERTFILDQKILRLKTSLNKFLEFLSKNIPETEVLSVNSIKGKFIDNETLDLIIEKIGFQYFSDALCKLNYIRKFNSIFDLSERLSYFESIFRPDKPDDIPFYIIQKTILNPYKYRILDYEFSGVEEMHSKIIEDLKILEIYRDKLVNASYVYTKCQFLIFEQNWTARSLPLSDKIQCTYNILNLLSDAICDNKVLARELGNLKNQRLFFLMNYHYQKILLLIKDDNQNEVINFVNSKVKKSEWYIKKDFIEQSKDNIKTKIIIDLCFLFFYSVFKKEDYITLDKYKALCLKNSFTNRLFHLVQAKFSLKACGISYPKEDKNLESVLLLKLKEILLKESFDINFRDFNIMKEQESGLINLIKQGEGHNSEFKASFTADINKYLATDQIEGFHDYKGDYIEAIVQFLNTTGGKLIIGVWEVDKIPKEIKNKNFLVSNSKIPGYCLTGLDLDLKFKNINIDGLCRKFDEAIIKYIKPNPFIAGDPVPLKFYKLFGRDICIIDVPKGKNYYHFLDYIVDKNGMKNEVYRFFIRKNHGKLELRRPDEDEYIKMNPR